MRLFVRCAACRRCDLPGVTRELPRGWREIGTTAERPAIILCTECYRAELRDWMRYAA